MGFLVLITPVAGCRCAPQRREANVDQGNSPDRLKRDVNGLAYWGSSEEAQVDFLKFCMPSFEAKLSEREALFLQN
ncbi:hypothetical protein [Pseudovibrio sp. FO-BEG1]|uniref:hypothetical protein n=1 Tax=Pseudovibrio sp. (strain FO-BEG1) TaxID=911045 RepID=UPI00059F9F3F|nr:hypothetical protein [Pseudovibrio sp. FO-BEG1]